MDSRGSLNMQVNDPRTLFLSGTGRFDGGTLRETTKKWSDDNTTS
jgi:hypothetical protein